MNYQSVREIPNNTSSPRRRRRDGIQSPDMETMAGVTGLEPAASGVTGRRSNQLSYTPFADGFAV